MKLVFLSFASALASSATLQTTLEKICEIKSQEVDFNHEAQFKLFDSICGGLRDINSVSFQVAPLNEYGCWCRFDRDNHGKGAGHAVDVFDGFCKRYHEAVSCLAMDFGETCNPWDVTYTFKVYPFQKLVDCDTDNDSVCARNLCRMETAFVMDVLDEALSFDGSRPDYAKYNKNHADFDSQIWNYQCRLGNASEASELQCCGDYHTGCFSEIISI